ncbi:unnamed protein product, partial [Pylaiella littoralis]
HRTSVASLAEVKQQCTNNARRKRSAEGVLEKSSVAVASSSVARSSKKTSNTSGPILPAFSTAVARLAPQAQYVTTVDRRSKHRSKVIAGMQNNDEFTAFHMSSLAGY